MIFVKNDVVLGENDVIRQNNVIFSIEIRVNGLEMYFRRFLFKSDFKSVKCSKIADFLENRQYDVTLWRQNTAVRKNDFILTYDIIFD